MRVALISDLHGNELALLAVLREIDAMGVDRLVCLGDVATLGPRPREVVGRLQALGCSCILGNHDEFLLEPELVHTYTQAAVIVQAVDWCRAELGAAELAFLRSFPRGLALELEGGTRLSLFHGSPRSHMKDLLATTPAAELDAELAGHEAEIHAGGHTHLQLVRQHRGAWLVNPGSVGLPFQAYAGGGPPVVLPRAEFAVVESRGAATSVSLHRVPLDKAALRAAALACSHPLAPMLAAAYA